MALSAVAAIRDPGETAVRFLEKVRTKSLDLAPGADSALSPQTSPAKRKQIARRLERMAQDLGDDPLEVGAVKIDGELAAVLVRKISGFDPSRMQVFPVALVKRGPEWAAAPVPASFENAGIGYAAALRERLKTLEDWMLRQQVLELTTLRDQSADRMRREIETSLPAATLRTLDSRQTITRFLNACENRKLPEILGLIGGLASNLPADWPLRIKAAESAVATGSDVPNSWHLLVSKDVLRVIVQHEEDDDRRALTSIACLDPAGGFRPASRPRIELVHLELSQSKDGLWRIDLPDHLLQETQSPDESADEDLDSDLLDAFPVKIREAYPASPQATADDARQAVIHALHEAAPSSLIRLTRLDEDPAAARESCIRAARLWWTVRDPSSVRRAIPLGIHEEDDSAAACFQLFSARNPDRLDLRILYFEKSADGWLWTPGPNPQTEQAFRPWTDQQDAHWRNHWQDLLLTDCPALEKLPANQSPTAGESRKLVESWLQAIRVGNVTEALRLTTRLNLPDSTARLFRNLGYELTGARKSTCPASITGVYRGGDWAAVGTRITPNDEPSFPLYPVVATPAGPRILLEIDLSTATKGNRDYLNIAALKRLTPFQSEPSSAATLKELLSQHQAEVSRLASP